MNILNRVLYELLPFIEFFEEKNLTIYRKIYIIANTILTTIILSSLFLYFFSTKLYKYKIDRKNMTIYSDFKMNNDKKFLESITEAESLIKNNILYTHKYFIKVFFVNNRIYFKLVTNPFNTHAIAANNFDSVYIYSKCIKNDQFDKIRKVLVHESIHSLQAIKYGGWIRSMLYIPQWVLEGYAKYIEEEKNIIVNIKAFLQDKKNRETYTYWALMVKHAIEEMHVSVDDLHQGKIEYDKVLSSLLKAYNITEQ